MRAFGLLHSSSLFLEVWLVRHLIRLCHQPYCRYERLNLSGNWSYHRLIRTWPSMPQT
jgi:hypothetical protein